MPIIELIEDDAINPFLLNHTNKDKKEFNQLSEEEKRSLIDNITSEVTNDTKILDELTNNYINQISKADFYTVTVQPEAGYVCKTNVISSSSRYMVGTIVYINVCYASAIPAPSIASEKEIQQALNAEPDATYRVPLSMGRERSEGKACLIMDACINTQPFLRSEKDLDYRLYILELAMEYVEQIVSVTLSREFTMPSIKSKGIIPTRVLRLPKPSLMSTIKNEYKHVLPKWELKHTMSIHGDIATIVIDMPDTNVSSWTLDITPDTVHLQLENQTYPIHLHSHTILTEDKHNEVKFYSKNKKLVIRLVLSNKARHQYL